MLKRRKSNRTANEVSEAIEGAVMPRSQKKYDGLLVPSGSVMLNLACSDTVKGAFPTGKIVNIIGDSSSGKTLLALSMLAEVSLRPEFDGYNLFFDDAEEALEFDVEYLFGKEAEERISYDYKSNTIEDYYGNILRAMKDGPCIYVLDSFDSVTADEEVKRSLEYETNKKDRSGSFKTEKARLASEILRVIKGTVSNTESLVVIISQTRDNIGFGARFQPKVRSGGKALKFYCSHEIWLAVGPKEKKKEREIGAEVYAKVSKNKLTGKRREIEFPIYYDYGADDVTAVINFLIAEGIWKKVGTNKKAKTPAGIDSNGFVEICSKPKLIRLIEDNEYEDKLFALAEKEWGAIEESIRLKRKRKYI